MNPAQVAKLEHLMARGRKAAHIANPALRAARLRRGWTEDDVAVALQALTVELGEPESAVSGSQVSKWERGVRNPGRHYKPRLCLVFEAMPQDIGLLPNPRLLHDIGELARRRLERQQQLRPVSGALGDHLGEPGDGSRSARKASPASRPTIPEFDHVDSERLGATLTRLWPVDAPLLAGLNRASQRLAERRDTEAPSAVVPALGDLLDVLIELLSRPQSSNRALELRRIAAFTGQNLAMAEWVAGAAAATYRTYAIAESLARESRSAAQLALVLVDRSEMAGQLARATGEWEDARLLSDAAETAAMMDSSTPAGVLCWMYGERATQRAMLGDERGSGRDLERMEEIRLGANPGTLNVFSPDVDAGSGWVDAYQVRSALRLRQPDKAVDLCERILSATDPRLVWQVAEALVLLSEAWVTKGELGAAAHRLEEAAGLARATENERDLRVVRRVSNLMRQRWPGAPEARRIDELLRSPV
jgi:transcriptional regulator with XRE-family HTH domain